jgi:hypothetical protein
MRAYKSSIEKIIYITSQQKQNKTLNNSRSCPRDLSIKEFIHLGKINSVILNLASHILFPVLQLYFIDAEGNISTIIILDTISATQILCLKLYMIFLIMCH